MTVERERKIFYNKIKLTQFLFIILAPRKALEAKLPSEEKVNYTTEGTGINKPRLFDYK